MCDLTCVCTCSGVWGGVEQVEPGGPCDVIMVLLNVWSHLYVCVCSGDGREGEQVETRGHCDIIVMSVNV